MKIGLVGYQGSGKTTLWQWLTGVATDLSRSHTAQNAMAVVPDDRVEALAHVYRPKKVTRASLELVDTPGLDRSGGSNAARLALIRDCDCLVVVVAAFGGSDPAADLQSFSEDSLLADLELVTGRIDRLREQIKKPRPDRRQQQEELAALEPLVEALEAGRALHEVGLSDEQARATRSFQLLTEKPRLVVVNAADDEDNLHRWGDRAPDGAKIIAGPLGLELELARMSPEDREEFRREMGLESFDRDALVRTIMDVSGQMLFFTASEKEVRTWLLPKGGTALDAAAGVHTDLARGFIRAEVIGCDDLIRLGSEREVKARDLARHEPKNYVVQDGDVLNIRFSV